MLGLRIAKQFFQTTSREAMLLLVVFLGFLWTILINHLRIEWTLNPQYGYGWAVPFLCLYLIWQRMQKPEDVRLREATARQEKQKAENSFSFQLLFVLLSLLYAPTRLIEEANPEWRLVSWALAIEVVGLTLLLIYFVLGAQWLKRLAFPIAYFLVAVPWPTVIEGPLIQGLTRADAGATCELLGWLGIPAMPHGNVIEVATGEVGIDEACSGIRSFQATLMISLFLGESYRLNFARRLVLILGGFAMSFGFNLARMSVLVWVAAHHGITAIAKWHDPTGITILLACFCGLWGLGVWLRGSARVPRAKSGVAPDSFKTQTDSEEKSDERSFRRDAENSTPEARSPQPIGARLSTFDLRPLSLALFGWILLTEISVEAWYRSHETRLPLATQWTMSWPTNNPTFKTAFLPDRARQILRYDESRSVAWATDGIEWQAVFLRWNPGRTALHLAQNHTPEVCLTAAGHTLTTVSDPAWLEAGGLRLPFIVYAVANTPRPVYVFYCLWDDRTSAQGRGTMSLTYGNRLAPVLAGLRNPGQRSLEIAVTGVADAGAAENALRAELEKILTVKK
jgi:exosortase